MKIALLLTGHYRSFDTAFHTWKSNFIDLYQADFYFHIWDNIGNRIDLKEGESSPTLGAMAPAQFSDDLVDINKIKDKYKVNNLIVENYKEIETKESFNERIKPIKEEFVKRGFGDRRIKWFLSQYYKRLKGIEWVLNQQENYDIVLLCRPDFMLNYYPNDARSDAPRQSIYSLDLNKLTMQENIIGLTLLNRFDGYHDFYMIGTPENLYKCCQIYNDFEILFEYFKRYNFEKMSCGHALLTNYIGIKQMKIFELPLLGYIKR